MRSAVCALLFATLLSFPTIAQQPGRNIQTTATLTVIVEQSNDRALSTGIQVKLLQHGVTLGQKFTDDRGHAVFGPLAAGYYYVEASGIGIKTTSGTEFEISDGEGSHFERIRVQVVPAADSNPPAQTGAPTVSAAQLQIPENAAKEFEKGVDAFSIGDNKKAEASFNKAIEAYPAYANAYVNLGVLYMKTGRPEKAKQAFNKSVEVDKNFAPGYVNLARLSFADHQYAEAEATVSKALAVAPNNIDAIALLATCEFMNKENEKALADMRRLHAISGHEAYSGLHLLAAQILIEENEREQAIDQYIAFLKESPNDLRVAQVRKTLAQMQASK